MEHIGGTLKKLIKKEGLENEINQQKAIDLWGEVVGQKIRENTEPVEVQFGVMIVKVKSAVWKQELQFQKDDIIESLNRKLIKVIERGECNFSVELSTLLTNLKRLALTEEKSYLGACLIFRNSRRRMICKEGKHQRKTKKIVFVLSFCLSFFLVLFRCWLCSSHQSVCSSAGRSFRCMLLRLPSQLTPFPRRF